jgi:hypothetical protein
MLLFELVRLIFDYLPVDSQMCFRLTNKTYISLKVKNFDDDIIKSVTEHNNINYYRYILNLAYLDISSYHAVAAAINGSLELLIYITSKIEPEPDLLYWSVRYGRLNILQWIVKKYGKIWDNNTATVAARYGQLNILSWLLENGFLYTDQISGECCVEENTVDQTVEWLLQRDLKPTAVMASLVSQRDNIELVKRIDRSLWPHCFQGAISGDRINILQWLRDNNHVCNNYVVNCSKLKTLQWLDDNSYVPKTDFYFDLVNQNKLDILKLLWKKGYEISNRTIKYIKSNGSPEMLKWLIEEFRCKELTYDMFRNMARSGDISLLELLKNKKCPMNYEAYLGALSGGHLDIMNWLKKNNCPLNKKIWLDAYFNYPDLLKWLKDNECPWHKDASGAAARNSDFEYMKWLISNGCPLSGDECYYAAMDGRVDILKWLRARKCEWSEHVCTVASEFGNLNTLKWLRHNGCPWDKSTFWKAHEANQLSCAGWAVKYGCPI